VPLARRRPGIRHRPAFAQGSSLSGNRRAAALSNLRYDGCVRPPASIEYVITQRPQQVRHFVICLECEVMNDHGRRAIDPAR
jgi:hypothetical protein